MTTVQVPAGLEDGSAVLLRGRVRVALAGPVADLVLARPEAGNALDLDAATALQEAAALLARTPGLRVLRVSAEGRAFCVGGDLREFASAPDPGAHLTAVATTIHTGLAALRELSVPVVSVVQGVVAGGGIGVALVGDVVLMARSARLVVAYTGAGLTPDCGTSWHLARALGPARALDLVLTNRQLAAEEAADWGLVSRVVDDSALLEEVDGVVAALAAAPTEVLVQARQLLRDATARSFADHLALEATSIARAGATADGVEGVAAFLAKRPPVFRGSAAP